MQNQLKEIDLTGPQFMIVGLLAHEKQLKMSELAEKMGLSASTVSDIVHRLERQSFVERVKSQEDGRVVFVQLTEAFKLAYEEKIKQIENSWADRIKSASDAEINKIREGLSALERLLNGDKSDD
jgi:DNA-binding MarR family transcriptional regulator